MYTTRIDRLSSAARTTTREATSKTGPQPILAKSSGIGPAFSVWCGGDDCARLRNSGRRLTTDEGHGRGVMIRSATHGRKTASTNVTANSFALLLGMTTTAALANTFTVTNTLDSGAGSLRQAISDANSHSGSTINFTIDANSDTGCNGTTKVCTIKPATLFDNITSQVTINGYSQAGSSANTMPVGDDAKLLIELDATNVSPALRLEGASSGSSTIKGLAITHLANEGILVMNGSSNNTISGNFIGVNVAGTASSFIGTSTAVDMETGSNGNTVGGATPDARNVLSGNGEIIYVQACDNSVIQGNYINVDRNGTTALTSALRGIDLAGGSGNLIGGPTPGGGNVIGTWAAIGIIFQGAGNNNRIQGNLVGTDATGTVRFGGGQYGVTYYEGTGTGNKIGGAAAGEGNVVSGATIAGVLLYFGTSTDLVVQGNSIGTDMTGKVPLGNATGIQADGESGGVIGGTVANAGNRIAFNSSLGVSLTSAAKGVAILGNEIYANGSLGISLSGGGVPTGDDDDDVDPGSNNLQNFPVISTVTIGPKTTVHVSGSLNSEANKTYRLEFFANASCDPSHNGEGKVFLPTASPTFVTTNPNDVAFGPLDFTVPADRHVITATATDPDGNTSEFSVCGSQDTIFSDGVDGD
jgi:hypothetical protein